MLTEVAFLCFHSPLLPWEHSPSSPPAGLFGFLGKWIRKHDEYTQSSPNIFYKQVHLKKDHSRGRTYFLSISKAEILVREPQIFALVARALARVFSIKKWKRVAHLNKNFLTSDIKRWQIILNNERITTSHCLENKRNFKTRVIGLCAKREKQTGLNTKSERKTVSEVHFLFGETGEDQIEDEVNFVSKWRIMIL